MDWIFAGVYTDEAVTGTKDNTGLQRQEQERQQNQQLLQVYQEKLRQLERKEKEIMQLYVKDTIDFDSYRAMKKQVEDDRATAQAEITRVDVSEEKEPEIKKEEIVADLKQNWDAMTNSERRQFLVRYIKAIYAVNEIPEGKVHGTVRVVKVEFNYEWEIAKYKPPCSIKSMGAYICKCFSRLV